MSPPSFLSAVGEIVRRADPDRFLTALFAPPARRDRLFTLYAFNHETARAREATTEPVMAMIRLQWWREVVEGTVKHHEVATPLTELLGDGAVDPADLLSVLDAREVTEIATVSEWRSWLLSGPGALAHAAGQALGAEDERLRTLGAAYGAAGMLRSIVPHAKAGFCLLPTELLAGHGLSTDAVLADPFAPALHPVIQRLLQEGRDLLGPRHRPGPGLAAALPAVLARRDLRHAPDRIIQPMPRGLGDRLAVTAAALMGRA
ncbi:squalene/phytoene synthase family protein [Acidisphaera sp. L21]|uniref:squalene/phytoene synthase family protein n=1 Tax=Acidisphaera sp. L21 TaxID=1641851 RepID=UPI00131AD1C8|nr:squalene/phytoene synthase family protein [Acidisphaera sp. L21]